MKEKSTMEQCGPTLRRSRAEAVERILACVLGLACGITLMWPEWVEAVSGADPDGGDGTFEYTIVAVLAAFTSGLWLRSDWTRRRRFAAESVASGPARPGD